MAEPRWLDTQPLDANWEPPVTALRLRGWHRIMLIVTVGAAIVFVLLVTGALQKRTDLLVRVAVGKEINIGALTITLDRAVVSLKAGSDGNPETIVKVHAKIRNISDETLALPISGNTWIVGRFGDGEIGELDSYDYGEGVGQTVTPGLSEAQPIVFQFRYTAEVKPLNVFTVGARELEYTDSSLLGNEHRRWNVAERMYLVDVPAVWGPDWKS